MKETHNIKTSRELTTPTTVRSIEAMEATIFKSTAAMVSLLESDEDQTFVIASAVMPVARAGFRHN